MPIVHSYTSVKDLWFGLCSKNQFVCNKQRSFCKAILVWYYSLFQCKKPGRNTDSYQSCTNKEIWTAVLQNAPQILNIYFSKLITSKSLHHSQLQTTSQKLQWQETAVMTSLKIFWRSSRDNWNSWGLLNRSKCKSHCYLVINTLYWQMACHSVSPLYPLIYSLYITNI